MWDGSRSGDKSLVLGREVGLAASPSPLAHSSGEGMGQAPDSDWGESVMDSSPRSHFKPVMSFSRRIHIGNTTPEDAPAHSTASLAVSELAPPGSSLVGSEGGNKP